MPKHKFSILTPKHNFSGINSLSVSLMLIYAPENLFLPKLASILPCWVTKINKIWFSKMKFSQKILIWTKKFLSENMLSYPLTNRKAKKNWKNRHFFGSWGGSLMNLFTINFFFYVEFLKDQQYFRPERILICHFCRFHRFAWCAARFIN